MFKRFAPKVPRPQSDEYGSFKRGGYSMSKGNHFTKRWD